MKRKTLLITGARRRGARGAAGLGLRAAPGRGRSWPRPRVGRFETTIDEDARTRLRERFVVSAPLAGRLQRITLREGDAVEAGARGGHADAGAEPDARRAHAARAAGARRRGARPDVQRAATRIEAAQVALEQARNDLRRTEQLAQQGFVAPTKIDADRLAAQAAQKELDTAVDGEHVARHELEQARAALAAVRGATGAGEAAPRSRCAHRWPAAC